MIPREQPLKPVNVAFPDEVRTHLRDESAAFAQFARPNSYDACVTRFWPLKQALNSDINNLGHGLPARSR